MITLWLIKIFCAHMITDFILQPGSWVEKRNALHFKSPELVYHAMLTAFLAFAFTGFTSWIVLVGILVTHYFIDLWKSYRPSTIFYFLIDQFLHILVILTMAFVLFPGVMCQYARDLFLILTTDNVFWTFVIAVLFITYPVGIMIGLMTKRWRLQIESTGAGLGNAGKWIGILERLIIFVLVVFNQYAAIGLLTAAKSILRYGDTKDAPEKTEYVLIGTLISLMIAIAVGMLVKAAI